MNYLDIILNEVEKRMKEKCRDINPMSMNFRDIEDVILDVKKEINKFQIQELEE
jgi:hypothetical protein